MLLLLLHYFVQLQCNGSKKSVHGFVQMMSILKVQSLEVNHKLNDVILLPAQFVLSKMILQRKKGLLRTAIDDGVGLDVVFLCVPDFDGRSLTQRSTVFVQYRHKCQVFSCSHGMNSGW